MFRQFFFLCLVACAIAIQLPHDFRDYDDDAYACEFCSGSTPCADGLTCQNSTCERVNPKAPRCSPEERCKAGKRRSCRVYRSSDKDEFDNLKQERVDKGFFVGRTFRVNRCHNGLKRFRCDRKENICRNRFCISFTLGECRTEGLRVGRITEKNEFMPCCVYVLPMDCYAVQLCRCRRK